MTEGWSYIVPNMMKSHFNFINISFPLNLPHTNSEDILNLGFMIFFNTLKTVHLGPLGITQASLYFEIVWTKRPFVCSSALLQTKLETVKK